MMVKFYKILVYAMPKITLQEYIEERDNDNSKLEELRKKRFYENFENIVDKEFKKFEEYTGLDHKKILDSGNEKMIKILKDIYFQYFEIDIKVKKVEHGQSKGLPFIKDWETTTKEMEDNGLLEIESWGEFMKKIYQKFPELSEQMIVLFSNKFYLRDFLSVYKELTEEEKLRANYFSGNDRELLDKMSRSNDMPVTIFVNGPSPRSSQTVGYRRHFIYYMAQLIQHMGKGNGYWKLEKKILILIPELEDIHQFEKGPFDHTAQITFERIGRRKADINVYWIPRYDESFPGRTTAIEMALVNERSENTGMAITYYGDPRRTKQYEYSRSYRKECLDDFHTDDIDRFFGELERYIRILSQK